MFIYKFIKVAKFVKCIFFDAYNFSGKIFAKYAFFFLKKSRFIVNYRHLLIINIWQ